MLASPHTRSDRVVVVRCARALAAVLALSAGLAGPAKAAPAVLPEVPVKAAVPFPVGEPGRPAFLKTIKKRFDQPVAVGELQSGWLCSRQRDIEWNQKTGDLLLPTDAMFRRFKASLAAARYPTPAPAPQADALFEEKKEVGAPVVRIEGENLQVGVMVKEVLTNTCLKNASTVRGGAYVKLFWQVFAADQQKVIFQATTEGSFQSAEFAVVGNVFSTLPIEAFAVAAGNLLADPGFLAAVQTPVQAMAAASEPLGDKAVALAASGVAIDGAPLRDEPLSKNVTALRAAVATVFGDVGSGTGFFIGRSGWLLTNQHVVGKSKFVKVRLATGRELVGEVQRIDALRDVALVKTESAGVPPVPVRLTDPAIGEDVYALGSPLGDSFNTTLTRGILSGVREMNAQPYLQSDVAILPGNSGGPLLDKSGQVVGITVMGLGAKGLAGMNFFIPIGDAMRKLNLQVTTDAPRR